MGVKESARRTKQDSTTQKTLVRIDNRLGAPSIFNIMQRGGVGSLHSLGESELSQSIQVVFLWQ